MTIQIFNDCHSLPHLSFSVRPYEHEGNKFVITVTGGDQDLEQFCSPEGVSTVLENSIGRKDIVFGDYEWLSFFR